MFNRSKLWALALLAVVFAAGAAAGWAGASWRGARDPGGRGRGGTDAWVDYLTRELALTPAQRDSVRAVLARHRPEMEALWREVHPRYDSLRARMRAEISAQLDAGQQVRYRDLMARLEHQHHTADSARDATGGAKR